MNFADDLIAKIKEKRTPLVVGLDPRADRLPESIKTQFGVGNSELDDLTSVAEGYWEFCKAIIDVVASQVPAVKPQMAFFEELGGQGMLALQKVVTYAREQGLIVIMDGKRNDIGSTALAYAKAYLGTPPQSAWGCHALTVNPWMGHDSLQPFIDASQTLGAGIFALVKTSNPGSQDFQEKDSGGKKMYEWIADAIQNLAHQTLGKQGYGIAGSVVGATYPEQLLELRSRMPESIFLIPGFGAQGGTAADVAGGFDANGLGAVVNSSRGIIFAYENSEFPSPTSDWTEAIDSATSNAIKKLRDHTPAGNL